MKRNILAKMFSTGLIALMATVTISAQAEAMPRHPAPHHHHGHMGPPRHAIVYVHPAYRPAPIYYRPYYGPRYYYGGYYRNYYGLYYGNGLYMPPNGNYSGVPYPLNRVYPYGPSLTNP